MAQLIYSQSAFADFDRVTDFLLEVDPMAAPETVGLISQAIQVLENHPLIGRPAEQGMRELVISRGRTGYIALYSYEEAQDTVLILGIRHQTEVGYPGDETAG